MSTLINAKNVDEVYELIKQGANINGLPFGNNPFAEHCKRGNIEIAQVLYEHGCDVTYIDDVNHNVLTYACEHGHTEIVKYLLQLEKIQNMINIATDWYTPLIAACVGNNTDIFDMLVSAGADINLQSNENFSPLMEACIYNHYDIVNRLLELGANVNAIGSKGRTAFFESESTDVVNKLYNYGADLNIRDSTGNTPINALIFEQYTMGDKYDVIALLIDYCNNVNIPNDAGETPIFDAILFGRQDLICLFLKYGADINIINNDGETPQDYARKHGQQLIL